MTQWGVDNLFNPGKRHMDEEKQRRQSTREEIGDSSGGKRIDLESGRVIIPRSVEDEDAADTSAGQTDEADAATTAKADDEELTPAQQRARDRRRRAAKK